MKKMRITLMGDETVDLIDRLCTITGLNAPSLVALLVRKYGKELEAWIGNPSPASSQNKPYVPPPLELPTNPGENLTPIEL